MRIGIDASSIRAGGAVTHLVELLGAADPRLHGFDQVVVWGGSDTLSKIGERSWLTKSYERLLNSSLPSRIFWQRFLLGIRAGDAGCDVLFVPGGSDASGFRPIVAMSQNLLPFEWQELRRFGWRPSTAKGLLLRVTQARTFRRADGVIFLTTFARDAVLRMTGPISGNATVIPHGINPRFFLAPRSQRAPSEFSDAQPCRVLYVSAVESYKHQWHVAEAIAQLRSEGFPVVLDLVGPPGSGAKRLRETLVRVDPAGEYINYWGAVEYDDLHELYATADIGLFASSCETFGQILTEAMSAGLPIACSNRSAMPELLGDAGVYFDPERTGEIAASIRSLIECPELRSKQAWSAFRKAQGYSWERCAGETIGFIGQVCREYMLSNQPLQAG